MIAQCPCAVLWQNHNAQGLWLCPLGGVSTKKNVINKAAAVLAGAGMPGSDKLQRCDLI